MKEIKIRCWSKNTLEWVTPLLPLHLDYSEYHGIIYKESDCLDSFLTQFTGLKDKNDKEIYEGDLCKIYLGKQKLEPKLIWKVEYFEDRASYGLTSGNCFETFEDLLFDDECSCEIEIIGNAFENPDLLNICENP